MTKKRQTVLHGSSTDSLVMKNISEDTMVILALTENCAHGNLCEAAKVREGTSAKPDVSHFLFVTNEGVTDCLQLHSVP